MMMIVLRLLSLLGLKSRLRPPNKPFFGGGGRGVAGFVDSGPKTLVPSASNRSTPPVDSRGLRWTPAKGDSTMSDFALANRPDDPGLRPHARSEGAPAAHGGELLRLDRGGRIEVVDGGPQLGLGAPALSAVALPDLTDRAISPPGQHTGTGERIGQMDLVVPAAP